ncbi:MAG: 4Fe-4S dicluster domain-containing protein [Deltaproteobacteria bacterium]|nr:4Fe-4S dicluster domain-containing protein [Deltaproteobacteria bacterium]MCL5791756.1 4Fe-4S dicluster domain-containing protein [Deltaproteobacteria bacterium]
MGKKDILAKLNLVYRFIIHLIKKPFVLIYGAKGYERFTKQYSGLNPVSKELRALYPSLQWCIGCGICVGECNAVKHAVPPAYLYTTYSRMLPELIYSAALVDSCKTCDTCLVHCPTGVQMKQVIMLYKDMNAWMNV